MIDVDVRVFCGPRNYVAGIDHIDPAKVQPTLPAVMQVLGEAFKEFQRKTGRGFKDVVRITIVMDLGPPGIPPRDDLERGKLIDHGPGPEDATSYHRGLVGD